MIISKFFQTTLLYHHTFDISLLFFHHIHGHYENRYLGNVKEREFISYTGDTAERIALRMYNLHPIKSRRLEISASKVKELMYDEALSKMGGGTEQTQTSPLWSDLVPEKVVDVIKQSWHIIEQFAQMPDRTVKIIGMKFPAEGIVHF